MIEIIILAGLGLLMLSKKPIELSEKPIEEKIIEKQKETVLPVLLAGEETTALPPLLRRRVYADFRKEQAYFTADFDLILSLYQISPNDPAVADLRESLTEVR